MRSPRGRGAGRRSALVLSAFVTLSAIIAVPTLGSHHLANERDVEPKPVKILVASPDDHVMLVGDSRVLNIEICREDGSGCKPATKSKATVKPRNGLKLSGNKGAQIRVTGKKPGLYEFTFKQGNATGETTVKINEPAEQVADAPTGDELRLYITPSEHVLRIGETAGFMAFGCPLGEGGRVGENGVADGLDDDCRPVDIIEIDLDDGVPVELLGPRGPVFGLALDTFPPDSGGEALFIGARVVTDIGATLPSVTAMNEPFDPAAIELPAGGNDGIEPPAIVPLGDRSAQQLLEGFAATGRPLGDVDGSGRRDLDDSKWVSALYRLGYYDPSLDFDADGDLDADDWAAGGYGGVRPSPQNALALQLAAEEQDG